MKTTLYPSLLILCLALPAFATSDTNTKKTPPVAAKSADTKKTVELKIKEPAPEFTATDAAGKTQKLADYKGKFVVLEWYNKDCPFVRKQYDSNKMQSLQEKFTATGKVVWFQVLSSGKGKEGYLDGPGAISQIATEKAKVTGALLDPSGKLARMYGAKSTPHMFIIDPKGALIYAGAIDSKRSADKEDIKTSENYVDAALNEALAGNPVTIAATTSYGCSIHYQ